MGPYAREMQIGKWFDMKGIDFKPARTLGGFAFRPWGLHRVAAGRCGFGY